MESLTISFSPSGGIGTKGEEGASSSATSVHSPNPSPLPNRLFQRRPSAPDHTTPVFQDAFSSPSVFPSTHTPRFATFFQEPPIVPQPQPVLPSSSPTLSPIAPSIRSMSDASPYIYPSVPPTPYNQQHPTLASDATPSDFFSTGLPPPITPLMESFSANRAQSSSRSVNSVRSISTEWKAPPLVPYYDKRESSTSPSTSPKFPPPPFSYERSPLPSYNHPMSRQNVYSELLTPALSRPISILSLQSETSSTYTQDTPSASSSSSPLQSSIDMKPQKPVRPSMSRRVSSSGIPGSLGATKRIQKTVLRLVGLIGFIVILVRCFASTPSEYGTAELEAFAVEGIPVAKNRLRPSGGIGGGTGRQSEVLEDGAKIVPELSKEEEEQNELKRFRESHIWATPMKADLLRDTKIVKPTARHEETVIFLHGLAQHRWDTPLSFSLSTRFPSIKWVMMQAPDKVITARNNESCPAWFNMQGFPYDNAVDEDVPNLFFSARQINDVIRVERSVLIEGLRRRGGMESLPLSEQIQGSDEVVTDGDVGTLAEREWATSRIVLSGFSQGGVMTLLTGLTTENRLAGLVIISGFMPLRSQLHSLMADLDRTTLPIFWGHGKSDPYLLHEDAVRSLDLLQSTEPSESHEGGLGLTEVEFHSYPGLAHSPCPSEMVHVGNWLDKILPSKRTVRKVRADREARKGR